MNDPLDYQVKNWGKSAYLGSYNGVMVWQGFIVKGDGDGKCSVHHHARDYNEIIVISGKIRINHFHEDDLINPDRFVDLVSGERATIHPGVIHQFQVLEDGVIMELYWSKPVFDIVRHNV
jgi:quercetin dioxygenase-like cupin family protein